MKNDLPALAAERKERHPCCIQITLREALDFTGLNSCSLNGVLETACRGSAQQRTRGVQYRYMYDVNDTSNLAESGSERLPVHKNDTQTRRLREYGDG